MKKTMLCIAALFLLSSGVFALDFAPQPLRLSAPSSVHYVFDGSQVSIPVTATGVQSTAVFCVYTRNMASKINKVQNGFLGWHYVNQIDTSIYISGDLKLSSGSNTILWDGKDENELPVPPGDYTYYIWAFDSSTPRQLVCKTVAVGGGNSARDMIVTRDDQGNPLTQPYTVSGGHDTGGSEGSATAKIHYKWTIGMDPMNSAMVETTSAMAWADNAYIAFLPTDHRMWFKGTQTPGGEMQVTKYKWVPNGASEPQLDWGTNGAFSFSLPGKSAEFHSGLSVLDNGSDIFIPNNNFFNTTGGLSELVYCSIDDGSESKRVDLSEWWVSSEDADQGGQLNGGPTCVLNAGNGLLHMSYHGTCIQQVIDPYREGNINDMTLYVNQNGDYFMDRNDASSSLHPWVCNDYNAPGISTYNTTDSNGFAAMPVHALGAVSFGLMGPDGTGVGYFSFSGELTGPKWTDVFVDTGCAYDGLYSDNPSAPVTADQVGWWYVAHDSIKGVISNIVGVKDAAPSAFTVAQNSPNPFNPSTTITFNLAKAGKTTVEVYNVAGQKVSTLVNGTMSAGSHSVVWNAAKFSAGVYFYTVKSGSFSKTMKMTLLK